jgi:hypothetical protein
MSLPAATITTLQPAHRLLLVVAGLLDLVGRER